MTNWLIFIIASLATYRLARMIVEEDGPAFIFKHLRDKQTNDKSSIAHGLRCFYCVSVWIALAAALLLIVVDGWSVYLLPIWWLGIAGLAAKIFEFWRPR